jgi:hypothetical protein
LSEPMKDPEGKGSLTLSLRGSKGSRSKRRKLEAKLMSESVDERSLIKNLDAT